MFSTALEWNVHGPGEWVEAGEREKKKKADKPLLSSTRGLRPVHNMYNQVMPVCARGKKKKRKGHAAQRTSIQFTQLAKWTRNEGRKTDQLKRSRIQFRGKRERRREEKREKNREREDTMKLMNTMWTLTRIVTVEAGPEGRWAAIPVMIRMGLVRESG